MIKLHLFADANRNFNRTLVQDEGEKILRWILVIYGYLHIVNFHGCIMPLAYDPFQVLSLLGSAVRQILPFCNIRLALTI